MSSGVKAEIAKWDRAVTDLRAWASRELPAPREPKSKERGSRAPSPCGDSKRRRNTYKKTRIDGKNRRLKAPEALACIQCGRSFNAVMARAKVCSKECAAKYYYGLLKSLTCVECGAPFQSKVSGALCCGEGCRKSRLRRLAKEWHQNNPPKHKKWASRRDMDSYFSYRRRAVVEGREAEKINSLEVFERDGWVCQICGDKVDRGLEYPDPRSASLDHIVPIVRGGKHTVANVQCSHFGCNSRKGAKFFAEAVG